MLVFFEDFRFVMPRTKFRSLRRSVTRGKRSRKPKDEPNSKKEETPSAKKLRLEDGSSSQASSKESYGLTAEYPATSKIIAKIGWIRGYEDTRMRRRDPGAEAT